MYQLVQADTPSIDRYGLVFLAVQNTKVIVLFIAVTICIARCWPIQYEIDKIELHCIS